MIFRAATSQSRTSSRAGRAGQFLADAFEATQPHELVQTSTADMSGVTGIYPAALGKSSNESSGKAIIARQREGDTGMFHYVESFGRAVQRTGEIIVDLIPHITTPSA